MQSAYDLYESTKAQIDGLCAERNALVLALAAKQQQVDGLVAERDELREQLAVARTTIFEVSSVRDDALDDDDDEPDHFEDVGGTR